MFQRISVEKSIYLSYPIATLMSSAMEQVYFFAFIFLVYFVFSLKVQLKIYKESKKQNRSLIRHSLLVWIIPFFYWFFFKNKIIKTPIVKHSGTRRSPESTGSFYESGKGIHGM